MPRRKNGSVYSVYHAMEDRGVFDSNVANANAVNNDGLSIYAGPVRYPKMLYHPKGETYIITQGIMVVDRDNRPLYGEDGKIKYAGTTTGIRNVIVENEEQEAELVAQGWHYTEAQAMRANPVMAHAAPPKSKAELDAEEIASLKKRLAESEAKNKSAPPTKAT